MVLSSRMLNRATLERQLLLRRAALPVLDAVDRLVGLQAQEPFDPYTALWSRLEGFRPEDLADRLLGRDVVRTTVMRGTIHLLTADDALVLRPLMQPVLDAELARHPEFAPALREVDLEPVLDFAWSLYAERPRSGGELRAALVARFPGKSPAALAYACRCKLALVQVPPRGVWGATSQVIASTAEAWLGRPLAAGPSLDQVVLRYLGAFGPATVADVTTWCRLTGIRAVMERLRPNLVTFSDEKGRELFDLPEAARPAPEIPAPARFLPKYDNVLLSHADRSRFVSDETRAALSRVTDRVHGTVLHDGLVRAVWRLDRPPGTDGATLTVSHVPRLTKRAASAIAAEGRRFLRFKAGDAGSHDVGFVELG